MPAARSPVGRITRGTTGTNRLRRVDRWIAQLPALQHATDPLVVDLGYGHNGTTTWEMQARLTRVRPDIDVLGLEIDPGRVVAAQGQLTQVRAGQTSFDPAARVRFAVGGFEVPSPRRPVLIRAMNVLRQYEQDEVPDAWRLMCSRLTPDGVLVEGTCNELGRVASWVALDAEATPQTFTISLRLTELQSPSVAAERLPKALIHRNVPGEPIHALLQALDAEWDRAASLAVFSPVQRWRAALGALAESGWPLRGRSRWRLGELTLPYSAVSR